MRDTNPQTETHRKHGPGSKVAGFDRPKRAEEGLPPEPGDAADRAQQASLDPDEQGDVGGDQDIDTAGTDADVEKGSLEDRERGRRKNPQR
jgi:hypothetical protein